MKCSEFCSNDDEMCPICPKHDEMITRLAAYENTGHTPEDFDKLCREMSDLRILAGIDTYEDLRDALYSGKVRVIKGDGWISASERLPKQYMIHVCEEHYEPLEFNVVIEGAEIATTLYFNGESFCDDEGNCYSVTHWQPLPQAPGKGGV